MNTNCNYSIVTQNGYIDIIANNLNEAIARAKAIGAKVEYIREVTPVPLQSDTKPDLYDHFWYYTNHSERNNHSASDFGIKRIRNASKKHVNL